jgi:hypothetical protein
MRAKMSAACPGGNGTMILTGFDGYGCAATANTHPQRKIATKKRISPPRGMHRRSLM